MRVSGLSSPVFSFDNDRKGEDLKGEGVCGLSSPVFRFNNDRSVRI